MVVSSALLVIAAAVLGTITGRLRELTTPSTSFYFRFLSPYSWVATVFNLHPNASLTGAGAGTSDRMVRESVSAVGSSDATLFPIIPKVLIEYGIPLSLAIILLLAANTFCRWPNGMRFVGFLFLFVLNGGPLNPATVIPGWLLGGREPTPPDPDGQLQVAANPFGEVLSTAIASRERAR
jgi:hypothetical protein